MGLGVYTIYFTDSYAASSASISVSAPKSIDIVPGVLDSSADPIKIVIENNMELNARALYENGDSSYVTEFATWESSDTSVITVPAYGSIKAVGIGKASILVKLGSVTSKHTVIVLPKSKASEIVYHVGIGCACKDASKLNNPYVKIVVNGQLVGEGLIFKGKTYLPIRVISDSLGLTVGYDKIKKAPTINGEIVKDFEKKSEVTYITAGEFRTLLGVEVFLDKKNKRLYIDK
ncbi:hypothetical protein KZ483_25960 [Paenibacillus sp. sptzw28]|uniref:hypothetical protein n=1 Tax=Paenibacillus sp. sptzw28 TaxID=715179 RepID=UPI001C6ED61E|nr:hypothetical protein [Paenibacillus sp. sptzw28]QYR21120.1 hypothetical protein KZ483_25960 [Paenibacillus sp. sptzw28]